MKKREELRYFLSRTSHLSERVCSELLMVAVRFDETASDREIAQRVYDLGVMKYIEELIEIDSTAPRWRNEKFYDQFIRFLMDLRTFEVSCVALIREGYIASESELRDLLTETVTRARDYGMVARKHLLKL